MAVNVWLDDEFSPKPDPDYIIDPPPVKEWVWVRNLTELKDLLEMTDEPIGVMSFDFHLGPGEPNGREVAEWLAKEHFDRWPHEIRIHSGSSQGYREIREFIEKMNGSEGD